MANSNQYKGSGSSWQYIPTTSTNIIWSQYPSPTTLTSSSINQKTYSIFKLPSTKCPELVFINGMAQTLGILGSSAQVAFAGEDLIIDTTYISYIILQYKDWFYHYSTIDSAGYTKFLSNSNVLDAILLSKVKR